MVSFSIDKQRGQVNVEWMSRPVDTKTKIKKQSTARLGLDIHGAVTYFCFSTEKKLLSGPILGGAYNISAMILTSLVIVMDNGPNKNAGLYGLIIYILMVVITYLVIVRP